VLSGQADLCRLHQARRHSDLPRLHRSRDATRTQPGRTSRPSSYRAALAVNIPDGYPLGAFLPLGIGTHLVGTDPAWLYQPCIAFFAAMLALALARF